MNNLRATEVARYILGSDAPMADVHDILDILPGYPGQSVKIGNMTVTGADSPTGEARFDITDGR